jgi:hypothetical protein
MKWEEVREWWGIWDAAVAAEWKTLYLSHLIQTDENHEHLPQDKLYSDWFSNRIPSEWKCLSITAASAWWVPASWQASSLRNTGLDVIKCCLFGSDVMAFAFVFNRDANSGRSRPRPSSQLLLQGNILLSASIVKDFKIPLSGVIISTVWSNRRPETVCPNYSFSSFLSVLQNHSALLVYLETDSDHFLVCISQYNIQIIFRSYITGVTTTRLAEVSGAARHLQKVILQIDKRHYFSVICISDK